MSGVLRRAHEALPAGRWSREKEVGKVTLSADDRSRRRIRLRIDGTVQDVLLDLPRARLLAEGDGLLLDDGGVVYIVAASEPILEIRAGTTSLTRLAYHLGNRHLPIQILPDALIIRDDHVIAEMVRGLGGEAIRAERPFNPEPGAYDEHERRQF